MFVVASIMFVVIGNHGDWQLIAHVFVRECLDAVAIGYRSM